MDAVIGIIAKAIADAVIGHLKGWLDEQADYRRIYDKYDKKQKELVDELQRADSDEERDAILDKLYNSHPEL